MSIAPRYASCKAPRCAISDMKTVEEVRRIRLTELKVEYGTLVALNEKIGLDKRDSTLSQILNSAKNSKTGKGKEMGSPMARKLEAACKKEPGWMDTDPDLVRPTPPQFPEEIAKIAAAINALSSPARERLIGTVTDIVDFIHVGAAQPVGNEHTDDVTTRYYKVARE